MINKPGTRVSHAPAVSILHPGLLYREDATTAAVRPKTTACVILEFNHSEFTQVSAHDSL